MKRLVAVVGPTATGKTALAIELAGRFDGEIVGADSRQVYRHMDIGTAKSTAEERSQVPHHLVDIADPDEDFSLGRFLDLGQVTLAEVWSRGKQPFLVGGTGQYVWALLEGWRVPGLPPQVELRRRLEGRAAAQGAQTLYEELSRVDSEAAARIDPRNVRRVIRGLEVYESTGKPMSYWRTKERPSHEVLIVGLRLARKELYRRIDQRVEAMVEQGLVEEVKRLLALGYPPELPSLSGIGYREICQYLTGQLDLAGAVERIKTETHRLVRRQNAWFKQSDRRIRWIEAGEGAQEEASGLVGEFLGSMARA